MITGNRIDDLPNLTPGALGASYLVDIPNGGSAIVSGNVLEKGPNAVNRYIVHFGGEGTYPGGHLTLSNNLIISDRTAGATVLFNQTADPAIAASNVNMPADILGNTLFGIDPALLFQDQYGPPFDNAGANLFPAGAAPALDTSPGFAISVMEPTSVAMLIMAIIVLGLTRHARVLSPIWRHAPVLTRGQINPRQENTADDRGLDLANPQPA